MERFVVLDVETTGVSFSKGDRIIQIAYSVVEDEQIVSRFSTYINPKRTIPVFIQSLTNIHEDHLKGAPSFDEIAAKLLEDLDGAYFVAHNADFDLGFVNEELHHAGYAPFKGPIIDTVELSRLIFPSEDSYRLAQLAESFKMDHLTPHRADSDAEATSLLLIEIFQSLSKLPLLTLQHLEGLSNKLKSDLGSLLLNLIEKNKLFPEDENIDCFHGIALRKELFSPTDENDEEIPDLDEFLASTLNNEVKMKELIPSYERRSGQVEMIEFIDQIFSENQVGLVEAGTGTGKTLAYLIPAALHAKRHHEPVIISTETIQLQEQIVKKELLALQKLLPFSIRTALLKGRSHYLCLQKFENLLHNDPFDSYDRALSKAQILVWLTRTETGDVEELSLAAGNTRLWSELASDTSSCSNPRCPWFTRCFYQRARKKSKQAEIIITNHALLFSDVVAEHQLIPSYSTLIVDEAHHLEDTATRQFGDKLDYLVLTQLLNDIGGREKTGWIAAHFWQITDQETKDKSIAVEELAQTLKQEWNDLFLLLNQYVTKGRSGKNETGRLTKVVQHHEDHWSVVDEATKKCDSVFKHFLKRFAELVRQFEVSLEDDSFTTIDYQEIERIQAALSQFEHQYIIFNQLLINQEIGFVYWLEVETRGPKQSISMRGCPIQVAEMLADDFFAKKERVVLTSATLTVNDQFHYIIDRLGLNDFPVESKQVESPFRWKDQVSFMVPEDMPLIQEVGEEAYIDAAAVQIYRIAQVTNGKMLVLFTSYDMLRRTYNHLKMMFDDSFMLIAQGVQTKSRSKLTKNFQQFDQAILLGTSSFWEGVDIPGSDLSAIVMARLPFSPPNDPVFSARSNLLKQEGKSAFMQLALPQAVLRFKQGFGRLIRRSTDRGIVVVLDRRIVSTGYGKSFTRSLPGIPMIEEPMSQMEERIHQWFSEPNGN